ncbi:hypothetical protein [Geosporobacter ferrireducens]|uniref:hypothetical protein n=1 Tax=Geosporobacter ferrireducens TaxID=1424294 RepID=UPI00139CCDC2|nr:hypothetical protein [Geosporobacter ferrireducens]MTI53746.1 hypothetical protein [Geosporobacter ferrireducens]
MKKILLLEPNYKNKYPPLGLMKLSYYHKFVKKDYVKFAKGHISNEKDYKDYIWDKVYITTLFTFEWDEILKTIEYATGIVKKTKNIYIGGIAATLLADKLKDEKIVKDNAIQVITGLLNEKDKLKCGYKDDDKIDEMTPDYSMLDDIREQYVYPFENAYFMYTTRGCGMNCGFCAVKTLEPKYMDRISIRTQIEKINKEFGEKKDLLLIDNNVLKSPRFDEIIDEIKELGFGSDPEFYRPYKNPRSGKEQLRFVDFNQGLDAFLLTEHKAKRLAELAIKPARIAFDHIEDYKTYKTAIERCAYNGIKHLSNYILYNSEAFSGKGKSYKADTPEDLYFRLNETIKLKDEINSKLPEDKQIAVFSFPMRYIPLDATERGYVASQWNKKYLRAVQVMLLPTQGKGVTGSEIKSESNMSFFHAAFGRNIEEFMKSLAMPEDILMKRGIFVEHKKGETKEQKRLRRIEWEEDRQVWQEWDRLYDSLGNEKDSFIDIVTKNKFSKNEFLQIENRDIQKIFLHYLSESEFLLLLNKLQSDEVSKLVLNYCTNEFPLYYRRIIKYIYARKILPAYLVGFIKVFKDMGLGLLLELWINDKYQNDDLIDSLQKASEKTDGMLIFEFSLLKAFKLFNKYKCFSNKEVETAHEYILSLNSEDLFDLLTSKFDKFSSRVKKANKQELGAEQLNAYAEKIIEEVHDTLFKQIAITL